MSRRTMKFDKMYIHAANREQSAEFTRERIIASNPLMKSEKVIRIAARLAAKHAKYKGL